MEDRSKKRKNFLLTFVVALILWAFWGIIFLFVPPEAILTPLLFLLITFLVVLFTASLLFANTRRGLLAASGTVIFMILNYYGAGNYLNLVLIAGILMTLEYYLSARNKSHSAS